MKSEHIITQVAGLSSPVSSVYARNAQDYDPLLGPMKACILRLGLSYGSPSNKAVIPKAHPLGYQGFFVFAFVFLIQVMLA